LWSNRVNGLSKLVQRREPTVVDRKQARKKKITRNLVVRKGKEAPGKKGPRCAGGMTEKKSYGEEPE